MWNKTLFAFAMLSFSQLIIAQTAHAWVDLAKWQKPKVFGLAPSAETAQVATSLQKESRDNLPTMSKLNASVLGLYPILDPLLAGFSFGSSTADIKNIPTTDGFQGLRSISSYLEVAALYAIDDSLSVYFSPGFSSKVAKVESAETRENFATLTTYGVYTVSDQVGLGLGVSGKKNTRTQSLVPLVGGAWQPTPEFRLDGWLPANVHARWKYAPAQSVFARLELAGDASYSKHISPENPTDVQLLGAQFLLGWSFGVPIGFSTGFLRLDSSVGTFKGQLTLKNTSTEEEEKTKTKANPLVDIRLALAF